MLYIFDLSCCTRFEYKMTSVNIVRVKRKLSNNHADALTISYKRKKICDAQPKIEETVKEIFKFIGTSNNQVRDI